MTLIWEARVFDYIHENFEELAKHDGLPSLDDLLVQASILRARYVSQTAYDQSISKAEFDGVSSSTKVPCGSPWAPPNAPDESAPEQDPESMPELADIPDDSMGLPDADLDAPPPDIPAPELPKAAKDNEGTKIHTEEPGFDGDRVFSNAILFMMEFGWWIELNYATSEGAVGF
ncbi:hypothetical protein B0H13DRAFT_2390012 [Mycena leptocephala]|nr:hypothetical protein B0H13DRAFT_2390012 [Mycena leptocephala]